MEPTTPTPQDDLTTQLQLVLRSVEENNGNLDPDLKRRLLVLVREMRDLFLYRPLDDKEASALRFRLTKILSARFNNYKNGTKQKGQQVRPSATLRVHYRMHLEQRRDAWCARLATGRPLLCEGVSSAERATAICQWVNVVDPRTLHMENFALDHWLEAEKINVVMRTCLEKCGEFDDLGYLLRCYMEPATTVLQRQLLARVSRHINLALYRDDLFGTNLHLRCRQCERLSKSSATHPQPAGDRYLLDADVGGKESRFVNDELATSVS